MEDPIIDCLIIGGGPAGLTAAIYLSRFHLDILVVDGGKSRASLIPCTRNHAGYPDGIEGTELLRRMREQACKYGAKIETEFVTKLERDQKTGLFTANWGSGSATARAVLIATGVSNRRPPMEEELHDDALARGLVRYCPICDGYEVTDKRIGVIGSGSHGVAEALFLRSYTADVTLIAPDKALRLKPEDTRSSRTPGSSASTARRKRWRSPTIASPSIPPKAIIRSTASTPRLEAIRTRNLPRCWAQSSPVMDVSCATIISARACLASMQRATSSMASTRSAMRWAKAA